MIFSKKDTRFYKRNIANVLSRKTYFFRRNLHINHVETIYKIRRIKKINQLAESISGFKDFQLNFCVFLYHLPKKEILKIKITDEFEAIITNSANNRACAVLSCSLLNNLTNVDNLPDFCNIWILKCNISKSLSVKLDDIVFTR